jgi:hypothetical protein
MLISFQNADRTLTQKFASIDSEMSGRWLPLHTSCVRRDEATAVASGSQMSWLGSDQSASFPDRVLRLATIPRTLMVGPKQSNESGGAASEKVKETKGQIILCNPKKLIGTYRRCRRSQYKILRSRCRKQIQQDSSSKTNKWGSRRNVGL